MTRIVALCLGLLLMSPVVWAAPKSITLTDGSVIKGEVISFNNGVYTINAGNLGEVKIPEENIVSILTHGQTNVKESKQQLNATDLKAQVQEVQGQVLSNPAMMEKITALLDDPQIKQILSDPTLLQDIQTYDEETIRNNPSLKKLLDNPNIQKLIKEIEQSTQP